MNDSRSASPAVTKTYRANDVVSCVDEGEDGAMLYNPDKDATVLLNPSGRIIWALLAAPQTLGEIAKHLVSIYPGLTREQAVSDAEIFLKSMIPDFVVPSPNES